MERLNAETLIEHENILSAMERLRADHAELEIEPERAGDWAFRFYYGSVSATVSERSAHIRVSAEDETNLSYMKMTVAGHVAEYLGAAPDMSWRGDGETGGLPVFFRELAVVSSTRISPHMQRVRFSGSNLSRFSVNGLHVRLLLPPAGRRPVWPTISANGLLSWPEGDDALAVRVYTIRAIDPAAGWLDVDFALHEGDETPAATFAVNAFPGDVVGMIGPGGGHIPEAKNLLLLGDDTAIPAISRILEETAGTARATAIIEVDGPDDAAAFDLPASAGVTWLYRNGAEPGTTRLLPEALAALDRSAFPEDVFVWAACEFMAFKEMRATLRKVWGIRKDNHLVVSYWRRGIGGDTATRED